MNSYYIFSHYRLVVQIIFDSMFFYIKKMRKNETFLFLIHIETFSQIYLLLDVLSKLSLYDKEQNLT